METIKELAVTQQSSIQGASSFTAYPITPAIFLKEVVDAAQKRKFFEQFAYVAELPANSKETVIPKRTAYLGRSGMSFDTAENTGSSDITWTTLNNLDGLKLTPSPVMAGIAITNHAIRTGSIDVLRAAQEELTEALGDRIDYACATALGDATAATTSARGAQTVYGGDARADSELAAGDTLSTDMIAEAIRKLESTTCTFWVPGSPAAEADSSQAKNPWINSADAPFVLFIGPEQKEILLTDSQFINAAEYGSDKVIHNGEIGDYLGVKVVVTPNIETAAASATGPDASTTAVAMARCLMIKAKKALAICYGLKPTINVFAIPERMQQAISIETTYAMGVLHSDAVVFLDVSKK